MPDLSEDLIEKILSALPQNAQRILVFSSCQTPLEAMLGERYPSSSLTMCIGETESATFQKNQEKSKVFYDTILVLHDAKQALSQFFFQTLFKASTEEAHFILLLENGGALTMLSQLLLGEFLASEENTSKSITTWASAYKWLLDAGWLPDLKSTQILKIDNALSDALIFAGHALEVSPVFIAKNTFASHFVIDCRKIPTRHHPSLQNADISVIVPVNRPDQFRTQLLASPGLSEINAQIIPVENPQNPQEAFLKGCALANSERLFFCHQDVYLPKGSGYALLDQFERIPKQDRAKTLIGFAGLTQDEEGRIFKAGLVVDRQLLFDEAPPKSSVISIDELGILLFKESLHTIDANLGWHIWATDLCFQAYEKGLAAHLKIARLPLFHNSYSDGILPKAFYASVEKLHAKYPKRSEIDTLCGHFLKSFS